MSLETDAIGVTYLSKDMPDVAIIPLAYGI